MPRPRDLGAFDVVLDELTDTEFYPELTFTKGSIETTEYEYRGDFGDDEDLSDLLF